MIIESVTEPSGSSHRSRFVQIQPTKNIYVVSLKINSNSKELNAWPITLNKPINAEFSLGF